MAKVAIGKIESIEGSVEVVHADGTTGSLQQGAAVYADDAITTGENSSLRIKFLDDSGMNVGPEFTAILHKGIFDPALIEEDDSTSQIVLETSDRVVTPDSGQDTEGNGEKIGTVATAEGVVEAIGDDGKARVLQEGDTLYANDVIRVSSDGNVSITMVDGSDLSFGPGTTARMDASDTTPQPDVEEPGLSDPVQIQTAIMAGRDPSQEAAAPAAGETGSNEGGVPVILTASTRAVTPDSGHDTHGQQLPFDEPDQELLVPEVPELPNDLPTVVVTYLNPSVAGDAGVADEKGLPDRPLGSPGTGEIADGDGTNNDDTSETTTGGINVNTGRDALAKLEVKDDTGTWIDVTNGVTMVTGANGVLTVTETGGVYTWSYTLDDNLPHPDPNATGPADQLDAETFAVRATDDDGDVSPEALLNIVVNDDGPTADLVGASGAGTDVTIDETAGLQDDDTTAASVVNLFAGVVTNPATAADMPQYAQSATALFTQNIVEGADGATAVLSLEIVGGDGTDSGLETTDGHKIYLYLQNDQVVGRADLADNGASATDVAAFAIAIGANGQASMAQYLSLANPIPGDGTTPPGSHDETVDLDGLVNAVLTVTDGDSDRSVDREGIGDQLLFSDDGPTANDDSETQVVENAPVVIDAFANDVFGVDGVDIDNSPATVVTFTQGSVAGSVVSYDAATGLFTYTQAVGQPAGTDTFTYTIEDGDGDTSTAEVTVTIIADSTPTVSVTDGTADEKGLPDRPINEPAGTGEIADGDGTNDSDPSETTTGTFTITTGSDTLNALEIKNNAGTWIDVTTATVASPVTVQGDNGVLTVTATGGVYTWSYTLDDNLSHPDPNTTGPADQIPGEAFDVRATDSDGSVSPVDVLNITVNDDGPTLTSTTDPTDPALSVIATVHEDGLSTAAEASDSSEGNREGGLTTLSDEASDTTGTAGSLTTLVTAHSGADGLASLTFGLLDAASVTALLPTLFSNGDAVDYSVNAAGDVLTATAGTGPTARVVFTLTVNTDGTWDFDLDDQLDHVDDGLVATGEGDTETALDTGSGASTVGIDFTAIVTAAIEDADGDIVSDTLTGLGASAGSFAIVIENDIPTLTSTATPTDPTLSVIATVHEDGLSTAAEASDSSEGNREGGLTTSSDEASDTTGTAGSLTSLVTASDGADEPGTPTFKLLDTAGVTALLPTLFSNGDALSYSVNAGGDTLTATAGTGPTARVVFTLTVDPSGTWDFDLDDQLDHVDDLDASNGAGDTETALDTGSGTSTVGIDFTAIVTAAIEDADGDIVSDTLTGLGASAGSFAIVVENDIPTLTSTATPTDPALSVIATVHEDGLSTAAEASDSSEGNREGGLTTSSDEASDTTGTAGSLTSLVTASDGADEPGTPTFKLLDTAGVTALLPTLFSNGDALSYSVNAGGDTLTATAGTGPTARVVFTLTVDPSGTWDFDLDDQLDHVDDLDASNGAGDTETALDTGSGTSTVGIDFTAIVTAAIEDADGDIVSDTLTGLGASAGSFAIVVENDIPTLTSTATPTDPALSVIATVHEDGLSTAAEASDSSEGNREGGLTTSSDEASDTTGTAGSLTSLVTASDGADEPGTPTFKLLDTAGVTALLPTLFSNGDALSYSVNAGGDTLTATAGTGPTARVVFTLTVDPSGTWDFDLDDQLDHVDDLDASNGAGDTETALDTGSGTSTVGIDFTAIVTAAIEDADGDIVSDTLTGLGASAGSFAIVVENDIPTLTSTATPTDPALSVIATVHEDGLSTAAEASDSSEGNREGGLTTSSDEASDTTGTAGSLTSLVTASDGADEPGTPTFKLLDTAGVTALLPTLFSNGDALSYSVNAGGDTLTATAGTGPTARVVFTLTVDPSGTWDFDLDDQLDHVDDLDASNGAGDTETALVTGPGTSTVGIDFTAIVTAAIEDADGDIVSDTLTGLGASAGSFAIVVENDIPTLTSTATPTDPALSVIATVHEDGLSTAAEASDSSEGNREGGLTTSSDEASDTTGTAGSLTSLVTASDGADEPGTPTFKLLDTAGVTALLPTLFSNGDALSYSVNAGGDTLTATAGTGPTARVVFTLTVDPSGTWDFDLDDQLDHVDDLDASNGAGDTETALDTGSGTSTVGIDFTAIVTAAIEDADGDIVSDTLTGLGAAAGSFAIVVENDIPTITGTNSGTGPVSATVHEDGMSTLVEPSDNSEGIREGGLTTSSDEASAGAGSLATLVTINDGADEPTTDPAFGLVSNVTGLLPTLFSHGDAVSYSVNTAGDTLTATADDGSGARTVFTLTVNADGSWGFDLDDQLDHIDDGNAANGVGDEETALVTGVGTSISEIDFSSIITVTLTDADGDTVSVTGLDAGDFTIAVENDIPTATPVVNSGEAVQAVDTNLMLILDVSGSMGNSANFDGMTRLEVMIKSSLELLEQYDSFGDVMVNIVTFSTAATNPNGVWVDIEAAKGVLLALADGGGTNYDRALGEAIRAFAETGKIPDAQNISYFMSDGVPTYGAESDGAPYDQFDGDLQGNGSDTTSSPDNGIQTPEQDQWEAFLIANNIVSWALGMGTGVTEANLVPIGYDGTIPADLDPIVVDDFADLEATLLSTIEAPPLSGEIIGGGGGSGGAAVVGADDGGWLQSFTVYDVNGLNPVVYSYDQLTDTESVSGGPSTGTFDDATNEWTVTTAALATLKVDMDTGAYTYTPPSPLTGAISEVFDYTVIDRDGDTASSTATLSIDAAEGLAVVRDDFVITNQDPTVIPHAALLANDTPANDFDQSVTGVSDPVSGTVVNNPVDGTVTFTDADGSFVYTNTSGSNSDTAVVDVDEVTGTTLTGSYLDEILIGGSANETLDGGAGDDVLVGAGGDNILTGGAAADTFLYVAGDTGTDEITDFDVTDTDPDTPDDALNIADLLVGEDGQTAAQLDGTYISIAQTNGGVDTTITLFSDGSGSGADQVIVLEGYDTTGFANDAAVIESLLSGGNLVVD